MEDEPRFVICIKNDECDDLEVRKIYRVLSDEEAAKEGYVRIIDDSGEDYLYPKAYFLAIEPSSEAAKALLVMG